MNAINTFTRWNDFESNVSSSFVDLRSKQEFFDVTLSCDKGSRQIQAHKVILAACSPFFRRVLAKNPHANPLIYLKGIDYDNLTAILNFMYHGEVNVSQEDLSGFLKVAEELAVKGLTDGNKGNKSSNGGHGNDDDEEEAEDVRSNSRRSSQQLQNSAVRSKPAPPPPPPPAKTKSASAALKRPPMLQPAPSMSQPPPTKQQQLSANSHSSTPSSQPNKKPKMQQQFDDRPHVVNPADLENDDDLDLGGYDAEYLDESLAADDGSGGGPLGMGMPGDVEAKGKSVNSRHRRYKSVQLLASISNTLNSPLFSVRISIKLFAYKVYVRVAYALRSSGAAVHCERKSFFFNLTRSMEAAV